eukprot:scaffold3673_cov393-Prasinococcus_capsulatus_cf.AAC.13
MLRGLIARACAQASLCAAGTRVLSAAEGAAPCSRRPPWQAARKYSFPPLRNSTSGWSAVQLLSSRIIWLQGPVDSALATSVIGQLLLLESESKEKPVLLSARPLRYNSRSSEARGSDKSKLVPDTMGPRIPAEDFAAADSPRCLFHPVHRCTGANDGNRVGQFYRSVNTVWGFARGGTPRHGPRFHRAVLTPWRCNSTSPLATGLRTRLAHAYGLSVFNPAGPSERHRYSREGDASSPSALERAICGAYGPRAQVHRHVLQTATRGCSTMLTTLRVLCSLAEDLMERDHWMTAEEAKELGLIDVVLRKEDQAAQPVDPTKRD